MSDGTLVGYARVSSAGQSLEVQCEQLEAAGCSKVFMEKRSGRTSADREALQQALAWVRDGDTLTVTRLDRLARSSADLHQILAQLTGKGVGFRALQQGEINTSTSMGKVLLGFLAVMAEFESDIRRERQQEGIDKAKAAGVYKGRPATIDRDAILAALEAGVKPLEVAKRLGVARSSVYRVAAESD